MRPLTDLTPKPLLKVGGKALIVWHLERLAAAGFHDVVINHAHLGTQLEDALGDGSHFGLRITYSPEPPGALETAGGIAQALPQLGDAPFLVVNGDIFSDWDLAQAIELSASLNNDFAHLVMVPNPPQHPNGDFSLSDGRVSTNMDSRLTFSGTGIYQPSLFANIKRGSRAKLAPLLIDAMTTDRVAGNLHSGRWFDVGTPQRLAALDAELLGIR